MSVEPEEIAAPPATPAWTATPRPPPPYPRWPRRTGCGYRADAARTGLPDGCATVVYAEAMLTMPTMTATVIADLCAELEIPHQGTLSKVLYRDDRLRVVGLAFDTGQELTEHTSALPVVIQVVRGRLDLELGDGMLLTMLATPDQAAT